VRSAEAPSYRERLRIEGAVLGGAGAAGSGALLIATSEAARHPLSTLGQLAAGLGLLGTLGSLSVRRSMAGARTVSPAEAGTGEPTPLWQLPGIVVTLAVVAGLLAGWDAALRVTGGCALVGLAQTVLLERLVAAGERREGGRYVRLAGSRILRGTRLGLLRA
jgi:hypothetical protein